LRTTTPSWATSSPRTHPSPKKPHLLTPPSNSENGPSHPTAPISAGFYRLDPGTPLIYTYTYDEMKIIVDGDFEISDESGQSVKAGKGDVFFFPKGSVITFKTEKGGLGFFCGQRAKGGA
jgi:uncharacterized cupin superfamily protein